MASYTARVVDAEPGAAAGDVDGVEERAQVVRWRGRDRDRRRGRRRGAPAGRRRPAAGRSATRRSGRSGSRTPGVDELAVPQVHQPVGGVLRRSCSAAASARASLVATAARQLDRDRVDGRADDGRRHRAAGRAEAELDRGAEAVDPNATARWSRSRPRCSARWPTWAANTPSRRAGVLPSPRRGTGRRRRPGSRRRRSAARRRRRRARPGTPSSDARSSTTPRWRVDGEVDHRVQARRGRTGRARAARTGRAPRASTATTPTGSGAPPLPVRGRR